MELGNQEAYKFLQAKTERFAKYSNIYIQRLRNKKNQEDSRATP